MTVLRKSKCQWCNPSLLTWWDSVLDSRLAERYFWWSWLGVRYPVWSAKLTLMIGRRWHDRFHK